MASLKDFTVWSYDQGEELRRQYQFRPSVQQGICVNLMIEWTLAGMGGGDRRGQVEQNFKRAAMRQELYSGAFSNTAWDAGARASGGLGNVKVAEMLSGMGRQFGLAFTYTEWGQSYDPFATAIVKKRYRDGWVYLDIQFKSGGHAIAVHPTASEIVVFDPNIGELKVPIKGNSVSEFAKLLWAQYGSWGLSIEFWSLYEMTRQTSTFEMFRKTQVVMGAKTPAKR